MYRVPPPAGLKRGLLLLPVRQLLQPLEDSSSFSNPVSVTPTDPGAGLLFRSSQQPSLSLHSAEKSCKQ